MLTKLAQENFKRLALLALLALGFVRAWIGHFSMNPDGISVGWTKCKGVPYYLRKLGH